MNGWAVGDALRRYMDLDNFRHEKNSTMNIKQKTYKANRKQLYTKGFNLKLTIVNKDKMKTANHKSRF